jgi:hypothetical protein
MAAKYGDLETMTLENQIENASFAKNNTEIIEVFDYFNFGAIIFKRSILRCTTTPK